MARGRHICCLGRGGAFDIDRPLRQDRCPAGGDERRNDRVEPVAARVAAASTRSQVDVQKSNQVNSAASRGSFQEPAPRFAARNHQMKCGEFSGPLPVG